MSKFNPEEEKFLERQKRLNTIHRNMMQKCGGDDSGCTTGPPDHPGDVSELGKDYLAKRVVCMQEAVDRQEWRQNDGDASRPEYWIGRLHEAKIALTNLTVGLERRGDGFGKRSDAAGQGALK